MKTIDLVPIPNCVSQTPWGPAQIAVQYAEGLIFVHTAGHGGLFCSVNRWRELLKIFSDFRPFNNNAPWLEEDQDFALAPLVWPEVFDPQTVFNAVRAVRAAAKDQSGNGCAWRCAERWLDLTTEGKRRLAIAAEFEATIAGQWERGGISGGGGRPGWDVSLYRGDACVVMTFREYPEKQFYSDAEIESLSMTAEERAQARPRRIHVEFDESQCGGAFDGFTVTSDADPGL